MICSKNKLTHQRAYQMSMNFKKYYLLSIALFFVAFANAQYDLSSPKISQRLAESVMQNPDETTDVIILLADKVDVEALRKQFDAENTSLEVRTETVIRLLKQKANSTQPNLINALANFGVSQDKIERYWIVNMLKINVVLSKVPTLTNLDAIAYLDVDGRLALDEFTTESCEDKVEGIEGITAVNGIEPGLAAINAPAMWALGYTGFGAKALSIDTGVEQGHPAISYKYEGLFTNDAQAWFEYNGGATTPNDCNGHGTHTVGTMLGLDKATNDTIGVAFDATWMGSKTLCNDGSSADNMATFQWAVDPDGDSTTIEDMPTVICNSWHDTSAIASQCGGMYQSLFDALEAVGVAVVFSAGNAGPAPSTITAPKNVNNDIVSVFCVGALNVTSVSTTIAGFSSRGPSICGDTGSLLIKPEVSAPGAGVRSADLGGTYSQKSGTSMAAPHVAGAIMLLKQAFPTLTGRDLKLALYYSAIDLGDPGEDNTYGMGLIDVYAAYQYLVNQGNIPASPYVSRDLAAQNLELEEVVCGTNLTISPTVEFINLGTDTVYNAVIRYTLSSGLTNTVQWNGVAAQGDTIFVSTGAVALNSGYYDFEIGAELINGQADERLSNSKLFKSFLLVGSEEITTYNADVCIGSDALLHASHSSATGEIYWYQQPSSVAHIAVGNSLTIPNFQSDVTYFADLIENKSVGLMDSLLGNGYESDDLDIYLEFDCYTPFTLKSVKVYTGTTGGRRIVLRDEFGKTIFQKILILSQIGENTINLNWNIQKGLKYQLGVDLASNYYVDTLGVNYPYIIEDVVSIKNSSLGQQAYPFFYDWQIQYGSPCGRVPATALSAMGTMQTDFSSSVDFIDLETTNGEVTFTDSSQSAFSWFWDFGDGNTSTIQNPTHIYTQPGEYKVHLKAMSTTGCSDSKMKLINVVNFPVSTAPVDISNQDIQIYPNPTNGILNITFANNFQRYDLAIMNALGQPVLVRKNISTDNLQLNIADFPKGIYFLQVQIGNHRVVKKVVSY